MGHRGQTWIEKFLLITLLVIGILQRLVVKPRVEKLALMILSWFCFLCRLVVGPSVLDRLTFKPICYTSNWSWLMGSTKVRNEEYPQKPKLIILVVNVDLRFGQVVLPGWCSDRLMCSQISELWVNWNPHCSCLKCFGERQC